MNDILPLLLIAGLGLLAYKEGWLAKLTASTTPAASTTIVPAAGSPLASSVFQPASGSTPATMIDIGTPPTPVQSTTAVVTGTLTPSGTLVNPSYTAPAAQQLPGVPAYSPTFTPAPISTPRALPQQQVAPTNVVGEYVVTGSSPGKFTLQQIHDMLFNAVGIDGANGQFNWGYAQWNGLLNQLTGITLPNPGPESGLPLWNGTGLMLDGNSSSYAYWPWAQNQLQSLGLQGLGLRGIGWA